MQYKLAVCGGTFDHFHDGHAAFLRGALKLSDKLLLGITTDTYASRRKQYAHALQPYAQREDSVRNFLREQGALERVHIEPIASASYPAPWAILPIEAVIATADTLLGARALNRSRKGFPKLAVKTIPLVLAASGTKLSSTDIRAGITDTAGSLYLPADLHGQELQLPRAKRPLFRQPFGELFPSLGSVPASDTARLVTVGDATTQQCNSLQLSQKLSVIDFAVGRHEVYQDTAQLGFDGSEVLLTASNPPGRITGSLQHTLERAVALLPRANRIVVRVSGEEDLAVIPLVLLLPLGFTILYGQPGDGVVRLDVTPAAKQHASQLLRAFDVREHSA